MDVAVFHTKMKTQRSFHTVLKLMEEYPEYRFMSSQPQLYEYMEEAQPEQFEKIRQYIEQGRWETEGGHVDRGRLQPYIRGKSDQTVSGRKSIFQGKVWKRKCHSVASGCVWIFRSLTADL